MKGGKENDYSHSRPWHKNVPAKQCQPSIHRKPVLVLWEQEKLITNQFFYQACINNND